jgi:sodium-dependent phosphate cotransporter
MVQSSSITTSLLVPLAGAGLITLEQAFPVTLGANIGTTVTALLASLAVSGPNAMLGIQIALIHFMFNISGTLLIYPIEKIRRIPLAGARWIADWAVRSRKIAILRVVLMYFVIPGGLVFLYNLFR